MRHNRDLGARFVEAIKRLNRTPEMVPLIISECWDKGTVARIDGDSVVRGIYDFSYESQFIP